MIAKKLCSNGTAKLTFIITSGLDNRRSRIRGPLVPEGGGILLDEVPIWSSGLQELHPGSTEKETLLSWAAVRHEAIPGNCTHKCVSFWQRTSPTIICLFIIHSLHCRLFLRSWLVVLVGHFFSVTVLCKINQHLLDFADASLSTIPPNLHCQ